MTAMMNPVAEMSQLRTQQTLGMTAPATAAAAPAPSAGQAADQAVAAAAAPTGGAADAGMAAQAVQPPPATSKIVLQSVLKGAMSGASIGMGFKSFGPMLMKVDFVGKLVGSLPAAAAGSAAAKLGTGALGFLSKLPVLGGLLVKIAPKMAGPMGFLIAGLIGAGVGAVAGLISGRSKAKKAAEEYAAAQAAAQAQAPVGNPMVPEPAAAPAPEPEPKAKAAAHKPRFKSWVVARSGSRLGTQKFGTYVTKGESMKDLCARFHTTPAEIRKLNPGITGDSVPAGTKLKLARKVVPNATAWKG